MLTAPEDDPQRLTLEKTVADAVAARMAAGPRGRPDADALALRDLLRGLDAPQRAALRAVLGRMEAGYGKPIVACGGISQLLAADRWGPFARPVADPDQALAAARSGARALIDIGSKPWWGKLLADPALRVIGALPDDAQARPRAFVVSAETSGPTGDDRTFWITDSPLPDFEIIAHMSNNGLAASLMAEAGGLMLFALGGYVQPDDGRLEGAPGQLQGIIGAAPVF